MNRNIRHLYNVYMYMYSSFIGIYMYTYIHVHSSYIHVYPLFRKESCKRAYTESQGLVLFGNKVKISPVDRDGKPHVYTCKCIPQNV